MNVAMVTLKQQYPTSDETGCRYLDEKIYVMGQHGGAG